MVSSLSPVCEPALRHEGSRLPYTHSQRNTSQASHDGLVLEHLICTHMRGVHRALSAAPSSHVSYVSHASRASYAALPTFPTFQTFPTFPATISPSHIEPTFRFLQLLQFMFSRASEV